MDTEQTGTVVKLLANHFLVASKGKRYSCSLRGKMKQGKKTQVSLIAVGDEVEFLADEEGEGTISKVLPRRNKIARPSGRQRGRSQVIVANVDQILAVQAVHAPDLHFENLDRCLAIAERYSIPERGIVINKVDLAAPADLESVRRTYAPAGYSVLFTSTTSGAGIDELRARLAGRTSVLLGPSGTGKSSLVNALIPGLDLKVGVVSEYSEEGRHTTTWVEMQPLPLPGGGFLIDTPGMEVFALWEVEREEVALLFPEMVALQGKCKFTDCVHDQEPGCAVRAAVKEGLIPATRHASYVKLLAEVPEKRWPKSGG